jgi:hypothetical protein
MGALKRKWRLLKQASLAKKRKDSLGPYARAILFTTKNGSFLAPVDDIEIGKKIGEEGGYDLEELNQIEKMLNPFLSGLCNRNTHWIIVSPCCQKSEDGGWL